MRHFRHIFHQFICQYHIILTIPGFYLYLFFFSINASHHIGCCFPSRCIPNTMRARCRVKVWTARNRPQLSVPIPHTPPIKYTCTLCKLHEQLPQEGQGNIITLMSTVIYSVQHLRQSIKVRYLSLYKSILFIYPFDIITRVSAWDKTTHTHAHTKMS